MTIRTYSQELLDGESSRKYIVDDVQADSSVELITLSLVGNFDGETCTLEFSTDETAPLVFNPVASGVFTAPGGGKFELDTNTIFRIVNSGTGSPLTSITYQVRGHIRLAPAESALPSDDAYGPGWNGVTTVAPSKNAVYDKIQSMLGKQPVWIPAAAMRPTVSNGCAALVDVETTAGRPDMTVLDFDKDADEHAQFKIAMPKAWDLGTMTFKVHWTSATGVTTGVAWGLQAVAVGDNQSIDVAYGTPVVVTDDCQSAAEEEYITAESSAMTVAGTLVAEMDVYFRIFRDVSDANDDLDGDARLLGVKLFYTVNAFNDA